MQLLKTLVEDFGGEATCSDLHRKITRQSQAPFLIEMQSEALIRQELDELDRSGGVTLETTRSGNLIARVTRDGAMRAYDDFSAADASSWQTQIAVGAAGARF